MSRVRVFVSSTFYDLQQVREDLRQFISQLGYDAILNEHGHIPYGSKESLEQYCYREIQSADILVSLIGGRYGSQSKSHEPYTVSQIELKTAHQLGKQVYIFIHKPVMVEYRSYLKNKDAEYRYHYTDNKKVFEFIEEIEGLLRNNPISQFEVSNDIIGYLREQWSGLFQRLLQEDSKKIDMEVIDKMKKTAETLDNLVDYFKKRNDGSDASVNDILMLSHPAFTKIRSVLRCDYPIFFNNKKEMVSLLSKHGWSPIKARFWDSPTFMEFSPEDIDDYGYICVSKEIFSDDGKLILFSAAEWDEKWVSHKWVNRDDGLEENSDEVEVSDDEEIHF